VKPAKSLRGKFIATMLLVTGIIGIATLCLVAWLSAQDSAQHLATVRNHIEDGIRSKGRVLTENHALAMRSMALDNAFLDMQRLIARAVTEDDDLVYGLYVNAEKQAVAYCQRGIACSADQVVDKDVWRPLGIVEAELLVTDRLVRDAHRLNEDLLEVAMPVRGEEQEVVGTIRYGLSKHRMRDALTLAQRDAAMRQQRSLLLIGSIVTLATLLGLLLSRFQAGRITHPVGELTAAARELAAGNRAVRVNIESGDELELLGASFNHMVEDLDASYGQLEEMNRTLEQKVQVRTAELGRMNRDMRLVLDNVDQGFVTLLPDGTMAKERSRVVDDWFGRGDEPTKFWEFIGHHSRAFGLDFQLAWEQVVTGFLPVEVTLDQLPQQVTLDHRTFSLRYLPFFREAEMEGTLLVIADISERLAKEREEAEQAELMQGFKRLMLDRSGFSSFLREATSMIESICLPAANDVLSLKRTLHTLKGNAAVMGLLVVARLCHTLEEQLAEDGNMLAETREELAARWNTIIEHVSSFIGKNRQRVIEVPQSEFTAMISNLTRQPSSDELLNQLLSWQLEPVERAFERLAEQGRALAKRLGKGEVEVVIEGNGVRLDPDTWTPFFTVLVHVVRNAIDHGIETAAERQVAKKSPVAALMFKAEAGAESLTFEVGDDGRGIDWAAIAAKAESLGLPHHSRNDLFNALLRDGISTKLAVTETSGRGVGMSAVQQRVESMQGSLDVRSATGKGTSWVIRFPWSPAAIPTVKVRRSGFPLRRISIAPGDGRS
jgi:two-component system, chemotaxis family, sensor kinase CheA